MKHFLASIIMLFVFNTAKSQQVDIKSLKKDPILIEYKKIMGEISDGTISRRYVFPKDKLDQATLTTNPSKENMKKVLKEKGMANADEYVDKIFLQTTLMFQFLKKHPEISKLDPNKKREVINQLLFD